jgi:hypothetical protein
MLSLATAMILSMSGCGSSSGGGSASGSAGSAGNTGNQDSVVTTSGKAVDGYLVYSTVCLDLNMDGYCQLGDEPATSTDVNGSFDLDITVEQQKHKNYKKAPLLVYGGYDADTRADFAGKLKAPFDPEDSTNVQVNVTPVTTMVAALVKKGKTKTEAENSVKTMLGYNGADLGADPVALAGKDSSGLLEAALKLQKCIEMLAAAKQKEGDTTKTNDLIDSIYTDFADKADDATNFDDALTKVMQSTNITPTQQAGVVAVSTQIKDLLKNGEANGVGTKIGAIKREIKKRVIDGNESVENLNFTNLGDLPLLHAKEILHMVDYDENDFDAVATSIKGIFFGAGMRNVLLPIDKEIKLLQNSSDETIQKVGADFEKLINAHEKKANETKLVGDSKSGEFNPGMTIYSFDDEEVKLTYSKHVLNNTEIVNTCHVFNGSEFEECQEDDDDLELVNGKWVKENSNGSETNTYTLSSDKTELIIDNTRGTNVKLIKTIDLLNPSSDAEKRTIAEIKNRVGEDFTFKAGSLAYILASKETKVAYRAYWAPTDNNNTYNTIVDFISSEHIRYVDSNNSEVTQLSEGLKGDLVDGSKIIGHWEVIKLPGTNDLAIKGDDPYNNGNNLIVSIDGVVYKGEVREADKKYKIEFDDIIDLNKEGLDSIIDVAKKHWPKVITLSDFRGKTFYLATQPLYGAPYISTVTFNTDGTRTFTKNGTQLPDANYKVSYGKIHIYNNMINIKLKQTILPINHGEAIMAFAIYDVNSDEKIADRLVFETQAQRDEFISK